MANVAVNIKDEIIGHLWMPDGSTLLGANIGLLCFIQAQHV